MKNDILVKAGIVIPNSEIEITTSRSGGAGGQHVNKTDSRITVRWNIPNTIALSPEQKTRVLHNLASRLTTEGDLIIHHSVSRSQQQNRQGALEQLASLVRKALYVPKKRMKMRIPKSAKESRLNTKAKRGIIKKLRGSKIDY